MEHIYCKLASGEVIPKQKVDKALELINSLSNGFSVVKLTDEELFSKGDKFDAIHRFYHKYDVLLAEAKTAIEFLRGEI